MADELQNNLDLYKLQLQQVEAALTADASEELLKLKQDLVEVIALTTELINAQRENDPEVRMRKGIWRIGDKCMAPWSNDGQYYDCTIESFGEGNEVSVRFDAYGNSDVTTMDKLKERPKGLDGAMSDKSLAEKLKTK